MRYVQDWDNRPPFGKSWTPIYIAVIIYTFGLILLLYWMTATLNH